jgi:AraC-like DNA-binding protein
MLTKLPEPGPYQPPTIFTVGSIHDVLVAHMNPADADYWLAKTAVTLIRGKGDGCKSSSKGASSTPAVPMAKRPANCGWAARLFKDIVDFHKGNVKITMADPCAAAGVTERKVTRHFKLLYRQKPGEYHIRVRLEAALDLLATRPELNIEEVSRKLGYEESGDFSKFFRRQLGVSPRDYRTNVRNEFLMFDVAS